ncbi:MAG: hypothetical protein WAK62_00030 [Terriglobales bacterium]
MQLAQFVDNYGRETWVNGDLVCSIVAHDPDTTLVNFGTEESRIFLREQVATVAQKLWSAARPG